MLRPLATLPLLFALSGTSALTAQEMPAHLASCTTDSSARFFLTEVQYLLSGTDSVAAAHRAALALDDTDPLAAQLVTEDNVCLEVARSSGLHPPYPLAVVRAGARYLARVPDKLHPALVVFDLALRRLASEGATP